jgi:RNA polymerase sigma factor (sigma-70 family)
MKLLRKEDDHELIRLYKLGNSRAIDVLLQRHQSEIYQRIYEVMRNDAISKDVLQESFIKILRSLNNNSYNEEGKFLPWAVTIAKNLCMDDKRKRKRRPVYNCSHEILIRQKHTRFDMSCRLSEAELRNRVNRILDRLPEPQRSVIKYRHYEDMSFKEISILTGTNVNTLLGRMTMGMKKLSRLAGSRQSYF